MSDEITREAFWNLYPPEAVEHFVAHSIRKHTNYLPELSFVIELDNKIIGSILYSRAKVVDPESGQVTTQLGQWLVGLRSIVSHRL